MVRRKNRKNHPERRRRPPLAPEAKRGVLVIIFFTLAALVLLSLFDLGGGAGRLMIGFLERGLGSASLLVPLFLIALAAIFLLPTQHGFRSVSVIGLFFFVIGLAGLLFTIQHSIPGINFTGGALGKMVGRLLVTGFGQAGALIIFLALMLASLILIGNTSLETLASRGQLIGCLARWLWRPFSWWRKAINHPRVLVGGEPPSFVLRELPWKKNNADHRSAAQYQTEEKPSPPDEFSQGLKTKKGRRIDIPLDLLAGRGAQPSPGDVKRNLEIILKTLAHFNIPVEMGDVSVGPTVTQYTLKPQEGIKLTKITALQNDLALALAAHPIRIEAPIPGKSLVGIEVPNQSVAVVGLREIIETPAFRHRPHNLMLALGKDVSGNPWFADLPRLPHLLVAGATGSGKTVSLNAMIVSLLFQNNPDELKLILVDPKRVELPIYNGIPHLLVPTITDVPKTINALKWTISEMERRFRILESSGARDLQGYNAGAKEKIPALVLVIDELADLMASAAAEVENSVIRIAQMARAVGIHLVVATQRPSVDVITGLIKANIPARLAFAVASQTDSRTILDTSGAEKLLGRGDLLFTSPEISKPRRLQGAYVSDEEIRRVVNYIKDEYEAPDYDVSITEKQETRALISGDETSRDDDPLLPEAKEVILQAGKASASLLQRRLKVGYARAARLLDLLEAQGLIGPGEGAKPREVLMSNGSPSVGSRNEENIPPWE